MSVDTRRRTGHRIGTHRWGAIVSIYLLFDEFLEIFLTSFYLINCQAVLNCTCKRWCLILCRSGAAFQCFRSMRCSSAESAAGVCREKAAQNMDLISKPRGKSTVWMYFGLKADERGKPMNTDRAVCRLCRKVVISKGNTTNLRSHLRRRHPAEFIEITNLATTRAFAEGQGNYRVHQI